jgi:hypothetical protein
MLQCKTKGRGIFPNVRFEFQMISTTEITACANESRCAKVLCSERVSQRLSCSRRHASRSDRALNFVTWPGQEGTYASLTTCIDVNGQLTPLVNSRA